jgi:hypothetical protein
MNIRFFFTTALSAAGMMNWWGLPPLIPEREGLGFNVTGMLENG